MIIYAIKNQMFIKKFLQKALGMNKKEESIDLRSLPQRKMTDVEKQFIFLETQRLSLKRESTRLILDKGIFLFLTALAIGMFAVINKIITEETLNLVVIIGLASLVISVLPYQSAAKKEEEKIESIINDLLK